MSDRGILAPLGLSLSYLPEFQEVRSSQDQPEKEEKEEAGGGEGGREGGKGIGGEGGEGKGGGKGGWRARKKKGRRRLPEILMNGGPGRSLIMIIVFIYFGNWNAMHTILFFWGKLKCQAGTHPSFPFLPIWVWANISRSL